MICDPKRGGCGKTLKFDDGAFCDECMARAFLSLAKKEKDKKEHTTKFLKGTKDEY